jgi:putative inorganic carbon (HCO3(-)) transporter
MPALQRRIRVRTEARSATGDAWIFAGLLALLLWLPLPWGSNSAWAKAMITASTGGLLGLWLTGAAIGVVRTTRGKLPPLVPVLWWFAWLAWIALSLWPGSDAIGLGPSATIAALQADAAAQGVALQATIAIVPATTADAWLLSAGYACLYVLTMLTCHNQPERMRVVLATLVISGLLQAIYGSLMVLSGLEWGFLEPKQHYLHTTTGTFVNRNHFAGYMELCGAAALGLILGDIGQRAAARGWRQRALELIALVFSSKVRVRLALVIMAIALVMTHSRSGNIAFFAAVSGCGFGYMMLRHRDRAFGAFLLFASVIIVDLLIVTQWYGLDRLVQRIEQTDLEANGRARVLEALPGAIDAFWPAGSGLGSFATAFAPFNPNGVNEYFVHAHNDYLQFLVETGLPGLILLAIFVGAHVLHCVRVLVVRRSKLAAAVAFSALMAIAALGVHSATDFNLQIPANAATLLVLLALSASVSGRSRRRRRSAGDIED